MEILFLSILLKLFENKTKLAAKVSIFASLMKFYWYNGENHLFALGKLARVCTVEDKKNMRNLKE